MTEEWLTVAQTAERLGTTIPRLRRLLARPEFAHCCRVEAIQTQRGTRTGTVVLVPEMKTISVALHLDDRGGVFQEQKQERSKTFLKREAVTQERMTPTDPSPDIDRTVSATSVSLVVAYEKVIEEQKARIVDLQTALEHERHQTRSLNEALLREQQLRLLTAPVEEPTPPAQDTATGQSPDTGSPPKPSLWTRLFGPKDKQP